MSPQALEDRLNRIARTLLLRKISGEGEADYLDLLPFVPSLEAIHPLTILSALPLAGFGALVTLMAFRVDPNIYAFVGVIMLVGLVKKNGIMMIDFALEARRREALSPAEAITQACLIRFRPIMMTTMAALPIAVGFGAGGESRRPLGLAVAGGLLFSQILSQAAWLSMWTGRSVPGIWTRPFQRARQSGARACCSPFHDGNRANNP